MERREWWATKTRYRPPTMERRNGGQQKPVTGPLQWNVGEWWATKIRYRPPTMERRMVGNKNTLPAPYKN